MGQSAEELGIDETATMLARQALRTAVERVYASETILSLAESASRDGDMATLQVLEDVYRMVSARAEKAWAERTEAASRPTDGLSAQVVAAADRELHDAEYRAFCALLGDQAALSRIFR